MALKFTNNAVSTLASSITDADLSLSVQPGDASKFPTLGGSDYFLATLRDGAGNIEIVKVTARAGAVCTIVRAQEGTTAQNWAAGVSIQNKLTAGMLETIFLLADHPDTAQARTNVGLGNVDNTPDADKPISDLTAAALMSIGAEIDAIDGRLTTAEGTLSTLDTHKIPAGTKALFFNAAAPTGWTKDIDQNDKAIRIVSGTGGATGGSSPFSTVFAKTAVDSHTLAVSETPSHNHNNGSYQYLLLLNGSGTAANNDNSPGEPNLQSAGAIQAQGGGGGHVHGMDIRVQYVDAIKCTKDAYA